jgi:WS/DGAT/MGAT family acyltransferase
MARLNALETAYLRAERPGAPLHVGSLALFEGASFFDRAGRFRLAAIRRRVNQRLELLPRLRQRIAEVPLDVGRPVWVDDEEFDIANHVDVVRLAPPGDEASLVALTAERYLELLDRRHPLWHLLFITGVEGGRVALLERAHHALVDGVSGVDVASVLLDITRDAPDESAGLEPWRPEAGPSARELVAHAASERILAPARAVLQTAAALRHPRDTAERAGQLVRSVRLAGDDRLRAPRSSLNAPVGDQRRLVFVRQRLDALKAAGTAAGATANDVVLAVVTTALRELLLARGEMLTTDDALKALVPVSVRRESERGSFGNRVAGLLVPLPVGIGDPEARLARIAATTRRLKAAHEEASSEAVLGAADLLPPWLLRASHAAISHQPLINIVVTNVPGPTVPLYAMGAQMLDAFPIVPLAGNLTLGVAVLSYNGALTLGITADPALCADLDVFVAGLHHGFAALGVEWAPSLRAVRDLDPRPPRAPTTSLCADLSTYGVDRSAQSE